MRNYHEDDVAGVIGLYDSTPIKGPFLVRNESFFRHFIRHPGVHNGVFVAEKDGEIEGIAIVPISEKEDLIEAKIIELRARNPLITDLLVQRALQYCHDKRADIVYIRPPIYEGVDKIFERWIKVDSGIMMAKALSVLPILKPLLDTDLVRKQYAGKSLLFVFDEEIIRVEVSSNAINAAVIDKVPQNPHIVVRMSSKTFLEIVFGRANPLIAYLARKIEVRGLKNTLGILKLLHSIRTRASWNVALVDEV